MANELEITVIAALAKRLGADKIGVVQLSVSARWRWMGISLSWILRGRDDLRLRRLFPTLHKQHAYTASVAPCADNRNESGIPK